MILDRELQNEILNKLASTYPNFYDFSNDYMYGTEAYNKVVTNLYYLSEHGLVTENSTLKQTGFGGYFTIQIERPTITHKGLDFLADDGGLSAILNTMTVKFDVEQFKAFINLKIQDSNLPPEQKSRLSKTLKDLPSDSIKHLVTKLIDSGWDNAGITLTSIFQSL